MTFLALSCRLVLAAALTAGAPAFAQAKSKGKNAIKPKTTITVTKPYRGGAYGFLPGYEAPGRKARRAFERDVTEPWYGWPGYYRGRWNGGGFGPCYAKTPIGPVWTCG